MIQDTIRELEARLKSAESVRTENKAELLRLLATLRSEVAALSATHAPDAERIADLTTASTEEVIRGQKDPEQMRMSLEGLSSSVADFEQSHPGLVRVVNRICETLANIGI